MTRNDVLTSSRRRQEGIEATSGGDHRRRMALRRLLAWPIALLLAVAPVAPATSALAAGSTGNEGLSGYKHPETAKKETKPAEPKKEPEPSKEVEPAKAAEPVAKASSLPFTGFDLRWTVGFGVLLVGAGGAIVAMQRGRRGARR